MVEEKKFIYLVNRSESKIVAIVFIIKEQYGFIFLFPQSHELYQTQSNQNKNIW